MRRERPGASPGPGYNAHEIRTFLRSRGVDSTELTPEERTFLEGASQHVVNTNAESQDVLLAEIASVVRERAGRDRLATE